MAHEYWFIKNNAIIVFFLIKNKYLKIIKIRPIVHC